MQQRNTNQNLAPIYYSLVLLLGLFMGYNLSNTVNGKSFFSKNSQSSLQEIYNLIQTKYVDNVNADSLVEKTAEELLSKLDPHSVYIPPQDFEAINNQLEGKFTGLGIRYFIYNDTITITEVLENGPAKKAGVLVADKIYALNDTVKLNSKTLTDEEIRNKMKGEEGSEVVLNVIRDGANKKITVKRETINVNSVDVAYMINDKTGYIKINKFAERTYEEFMVQMEILVKQKMQNLILDLRDNGGGFMHAATSIADEFLDGDKLIVYTQGSHSQRDEKFCQKEGIFEKGNLVVLINEGSASASEVLAGALQDWDRATIIGKRSFGKGLVQQQYKLSNGGALRLTTARYYSPLGRNIQKPYSNGKEEYLQEVYSRTEKLTAKDSQQLFSKTYTTPSGKKLFGGGGIMPDIYIIEDTSLVHTNYYKLYTHNTLEKFVLYLYKSKGLYDQKATINEEVMNEMIEKNYTYLINISKADSIDLDFSDLKIKQNIFNKTSVNLTKLISGNTAFFKAINKQDSSVLKALMFIK